LLLLFALKRRQHICLIKNLHSSGVTLVNKQPAMMHARQMQNLSRLPFAAAFSAEACLHISRVRRQREHIIQPVSFDACYLAIILTLSTNLSTRSRNLNFSFSLAQI